MTQQELADHLGVSRNYIALVENGRKPFSDKLKNKLSLVNTDKLITTNTSLSHAVIDSVICPHCAEKDAQIFVLERKLDQANESINNLTRVLAQGRAPVIAVSGVADGGHKERRDA
jgi:transcriptional regulator with XRE-family HTH domain